MGVGAAVVRSNWLALASLCRLTRSWYVAWRRLVAGSHRYFNKVAKFRYLKIAVTNHNLIHEEIKRRLIQENPCYHSVWKLLSCDLLSKEVKIEIYRTIILPIVLYGCEIWSHIKERTKSI
jgi:hypothetical protein